MIKVTAEQVLNLEESLKQSQTGSYLTRFLISAYHLTSLSCSALSDIKEERKRLRLIEEVYEHDQEVIKQQQKVSNAELV